MLLERIISEGIAHYSYLIGDGTEAVVIDPRRDVDVYLMAASRSEMSVSHILETHRNEDYFIGSMELASRTGGQVWHADSQWDYNYGRPALPGQRWKLGRLEIEAIATPGHTPGSMSYLLHDPSGIPWMLFCGDVLFAGEVGRIDLLGQNRAPKMARLLYESIFDRILALGDEVILCPAHGSGSVCGEAIAERLWTTIGLERKYNPRLQITDKDNFVASLLNSRQDRPPYFRRMEAVNLEGGPLLAAAPPLLAQNARSFSALVRRENAQIIDVRQETAYSSAHIAGSQFIWLDGLAAFAGWFVSYDRPIALVGSSEGDIEKARTILRRLGFDCIFAYLAGGMLGWHMSGLMSQAVRTITVQEICWRLDGRLDESSVSAKAAKRVSEGAKEDERDNEREGEIEGSDGRREEELWILDVRTDSELERDGGISGARHIPLTKVAGRKREVPKDETVYIFCGSGLRSMVAASYLMARGWTDLAVIMGGLYGWRSKKCPLNRGS